MLFEAMASSSDCIFLRMGAIIPLSTIELHWLPVKHRVTYKMAELTSTTMSSSTPAYLNDLIQKAVPVRPLRSSDTPLLKVPRTWTEFAHQSFSVAAPHTWNSLPSDVRSCRTVDTFKWYLKTHLFRQS